MPFQIVDNIDNKLTPEAVASLKKNGVGIKGEFITGIGRHSLPSVNIDLRKTLGLYANVVHAFNPPGINSRHENVDIVIIRENTEGMYFHFYFYIMYLTSFFFLLKVSTPEWNTRLLLESQNP